MRLRLLIVLVGFVLVIGCLPYLLHRAALPSVFLKNTQGTTLAWQDGPDVELNAASLRQLTTEAESMVRQETGGQIMPVHLKSLGKRRVELTVMGSPPLSSELEDKVEARIQARLPEVAQAQEHP